MAVRMPQGTPSSTESRVAASTRARVLMVGAQRPRFQSSPKPSNTNTGNPGRLVAHQPKAASATMNSQGGGSSSACSK